MKKYIPSIFIAIMLFGFGFLVGEKSATQRIEAQAKLDSLTIQNHEQTIQTINTEPDTAAMRRFNENFGSKPNKH